MYERQAVVRPVPGAGQGHDSRTGGSSRGRPEVLTIFKERSMSMSMFREVEDSEESDGECTNAK